MSVRGKGIYQNPVYDREDLHGGSRSKFPKRLEPKIAGRAQKVEHFGDPLLPGFEDAHIVQVKLAGFEAVKRDILMHKLVAPKLIDAFAEIAGLRLPYRFLGVSSYMFRYAKTVDNFLALQHTGLYPASTLGGDWNERWAALDRDHGRMSESVKMVTEKWDGKWRVREEMLSNHAYGTAIDINPGSNPMLADAAFDIPPQVVEVLQKHNFSWGVSFNDFMHFEYLQADVRVGARVESRVTFPLAPGPRAWQSPLKYFAANEAPADADAADGFFIVGTSRNLHAGIHVRPRDLGNTPANLVRAPLPGQVLAARMALPPDDARGTLRAVSGGRPPGFVLLRHELIQEDESSEGSDQDSEQNEVTQQTQTAKQAPKARCLYSLYMHLDAPEWESADAEGAQAVPWLSRLLQMQFGAVVNLGANAQGIGKSHWLKATANPEQSDFDVEDGISLVAFKRGERTALAKPAPKEVSEAISAFKRGAIVTFPEPVFPVRQGDPVGFLPAGTDACLHWEMFALPGDTDAIAEVFKRASEKGVSLPALVTVSDLREDNFITMPTVLDKVEGKSNVENEMSTLLDKLDTVLKGKLKGFPYAGEVRSHFRDPATFVSGQRPEGQGAFTFPVEFEFAFPDEKYQAGADGVSLKLTFFRNGEPLSSKVLTIANARSARFTVDVPARADQVKLESEGLFFDDASPYPKKEPTRKAGDSSSGATKTNSDKQIRQQQEAAERRSRLELLAAGVTRRLRNGLLEHLSEWTPDGFDKLLEAQRREGALHQLLRKPDDDEEFGALKRHLRALVWWGRSRSESDPLGELTFSGAKGTLATLFGEGEGQLPANAQVKSAHPVTLCWVLDVLIDAGLVGFRDLGRALPLLKSESTQKPLFFGLVGVDAHHTVGKELHAVLVQHGFGTTTTAEVQFVFKGPFGETTLSAAYSDGVACQIVRLAAWGPFSAAAQTVGGQRFEPLERGTTSGEIPRPVQTRAPFTSLPKKRGKVAVVGEYQATLVCRDHTPERLEGYLFFECWLGARGQKTPPEGGGRMAGAALAVTAERVHLGERTVGGVVLKDNLVVGINPGARTPKNPRLPDSPFSLNDFRSHRKFGPVFTGDLDFVEALEQQGIPLEQLTLLTRFQAACDRRKAGKLALRTWTPERKRILFSAASGRNRDLDAIENAIEGLADPELFSLTRVRSDEPDDDLLELVFLGGGEFGTLAFDFEPSRALGLIAETWLTEPGQVLFARPIFIAPNGGWLDPGQLDGEALPLDFETVKRARGADPLVWEGASALPPITRAGFGEIAMRMGQGSVGLSVALEGPNEAWKLAAPVFKIETPGEEARFVGTVKSGALVAELPIARKRQPVLPFWGNESKISVEILHPSQLPAAPPPPAPVTFGGRPKLLSLEKVIDLRDVRLKGMAACVPTNFEFKISCEMDGAPAPQLDSKVQYTFGSNQHFGVCNGAGLFEAVIHRADLPLADRYRFTWVGTGASIYGVPLEPMRLAVDVDVHDLENMTGNNPQERKP